MSREKHQLWLEAPAVVDAIPSAASNIEVGIRIAGVAVEVEALKTGCNCGTGRGMQKTHSCAGRASQFMGSANLADEFGKDFTIVAPDMRDLGESSRPTAGYDKKTIVLTFMN